MHLLGEDLREFVSSHRLLGHVWQSELPPTNLNVIMIMMTMTDHQHHHINMVLIIAISRMIMIK